MLQKKTLISIAVLFLVFLPIEGYPKKQHTYSTQGKETFLEKNSVFESEILKNPHVYKIEVPEKVFVKLLIEQKDADLVVSIGNEFNEKVFERANLSGDFRKFVSFVAEKSGVYTITVDALDKNVPFAKYKIKLSELRLSTLEDKEKIAGEKLFLEGQDLQYTYEKNSLKLAIEKYLQANSIYKKIGDLAKQQKCLLYLGESYDELEEKDKALDFYEKSLAIAKDLNDKYAESELLNNIGLVYSYIGYLDKSLDCYNKALDILNNGYNDDAVRKTVLNNLGLVCKLLNKKEDALNYYKQSLSMNVLLKDTSQQIINLINIGSIYTDLGEIKQSLECFEEALSLSKKINQLSSEITILVKIATIYTISDPQKSLEYLFEALQTNKRNPSQQSEGIILNEIGSVYLFSKYPEKALDYYLRSLEIFLSLNSLVDQSGVCNNIGNTYIALKKYTKAVDFFNRSLSLSSELNLRDQESKRLNNLGICYRELGDLERSESYIKQALNLATKELDRIGELDYLCSLAYTYYAQGKHMEAENIVSKCLTTAEQLFNNKAKLQCLFILAKIHLEQKKYGETIKFIDKALLVLDTNIHALKLDDLRISYTSYLQDFCELAITAYITQGNITNDHSYYLAALEFSEYSRNRSFIELVNEKKLLEAEAESQTDKDLLLEKGNLLNTLNYKALHFRDILNTKHSESEQLSVRIEIDSLVKQIGLIESKILTNNPKYNTLRQIKRFSVGDIQKKVLDPESVLLEYFVGKKETYLWLVTTTSVKLCILPNKEQIEEVAIEFFDLSRSLRENSEKTQKSRYVDLSKSLSKILLLPVAKEIIGKRLIIVPDKVIHFVPFVVLPSPDVIERKFNSIYMDPLVVKHEIVVLPSASAFILLRERTTERKSSDKDLAVIADPVFDRHDTRVSRRISAKDTALNVERLKGETEANYLNNSVRQDLNLTEVNRLIYTREEAKRIKMGMSNLEVELFLDFDSSLENLVNKLSNFKAVHFSTHALINSKYPELSGLVLSLVDSNGKDKRGFLTTNEILNLELRAEFVVLSACKTGAGKQVNGEGIIGLTRAFFYAGTKRVIASLWNIEDESTCELMTNFYKTLLENKTSPSAALRHAQILMLRNKKYSYPFYWAAFQAHGEWK